MDSSADAGIRKPSSTESGCSSGNSSQDSSISKMTIQLTQMAVTNLMNPKHRISDKLFKYQGVMSKREQKKTVAADIFIISFLVDTVFQVIRQIMWAASHIVNKEKFKFPVENLQNQLYLLSKYEHKIRIALADETKVNTDFVDDIRQLRHNAEQFLDQLERKWYINLWLHEQEIMEEFEAVREAIEEIKGTIIESLLDCLEIEATTRMWHMVPTESRERMESNSVDELLIQWDSI